MTINHRDFIGDTKKIIIAEGIAPINGPKKGIIFVIPTIKDTKIVYGILTMVNTIKVNIPIIMESNIFPDRKLPNILLLLWLNSIILFALSSENKALVIFFPKLKPFLINQ